MNVANGIINNFQNKKHFPEHVEWIDSHLLKFYPKNEIKVFHEILSLDFHLDIYIINSKKNKFNILLTSGMSSYEMILDENIENKNDLKFAELMFLIPKDIKFSEVYTGENKNDWIISMLKQTARFPHHYETWLGIGHTINATEDAMPYDRQTKYTGGIILPSVTFEKDFTEIRKKGNLINIYSFFPLYKNEIEYKVKNGYNAFLDNIIKANSKEVFNNKRKNIIKRNSGLFSFLKK